MSNAWYLLDGQKQVGPMALEVLKALRAHGKVSDEQFVWTQGMPSWVKASEIPALANGTNPIATNNHVTSQPEIPSQKKEEAGPPDQTSMESISVPDQGKGEARKPDNTQTQRAEASDDASGCFYFVLIPILGALYYLSSWWDERRIIHSFVESNIQKNNHVPSLQRSIFD